MQLTHVVFGQGRHQYRGFANCDFDGGKQSLQESVHSERRGQEWDPREPGITVHVRNRPGKLGRTTGQTKMSGSHLMVEVDFGPNEKSYKRFAVLERQAEQLGVERLIREGRFGGADDLRRILERFSPRWNRTT